MDKYNILIDGTLAGLTAIANVDDGDYESLIYPVRELAEVLANAAKAEALAHLEECDVLIDAIAYAITELLDCIDSEGTYERCNIVASLAKALAQVAKGNTNQKKAQILLMPAVGD
ncbi:MAG: hypothetical protein KME46_34160 [Brasilonema angustatum HA4187-MV1]|jgi:hypothetical protein|nr:hypothetical protein [Brasilonema angustatum HA4187-MV1]